MNNTTINTINEINEQTNTIDVYINTSPTSLFTNQMPSLYEGLEENYRKLFKVAEVSISENIKANEGGFKNLTNEDWNNIYISICNKIDKYTLSTLHYIAYYTYYHKSSEMYAPYAENSTLEYTTYQFNDWLTIKAIKNIILPYPYPKIFRYENVESEKELRDKFKIRDTDLIHRVVSVDMTENTLYITNLIENSKRDVLYRSTEEFLFYGQLVVIAVSRYGIKKQIKVYTNLTQLEKTIIKYPYFCFGDI